MALTCEAGLGDDLWLGGDDDVVVDHLGRVVDLYLVLPVSKPRTGMLSPQHTNTRPVGMDR